ncbi:MAG: hypothetical protein ACK5LL_13525 [Suipraeoptans sp.]
MQSEEHQVISDNIEILNGKLQKKKASAIQEMRELVEQYNEAVRREERYIKELDDDLYKQNDNIYNLKKECIEVQDRIENKADEVVESDDMMELQDIFLEAKEESRKYVKEQTLQTEQELQEIQSKSAEIIASAKEEAAKLQANLVENHMRSINAQREEYARERREFEQMKVDMLSKSQEIVASANIEREQAMMASEEIMKEVDDNLQRIDLKEKVIDEKVVPLLNKNFGALENGFDELRLQLTKTMDEFANIAEGLQ